jgi:hypothetical protein
MKGAALVFLAAGAFAAALILGAVSLGSASPSPQPIALHETGGRGAGPAPALKPGALGERRVEVRQRVELTTLSAYRAPGRAGRAH